MTSPIRAAGAALVLGAVVGRFGGAPGWIDAVCALGALAVATAVVVRFRGRRPAWTVAVVLLGLAASGLRAAETPGSGLDLPGHAVASVEGTVVTGPDPLAPRTAGAADPARCVVALRLDLGTLDARVLLEGAADAPLPEVLPGDRVRVVGRVRPRRATGNPGASVARRGDRRMLDVDAATVERLDTPALAPLDALRRAAQRLRIVLRDRLRAACGGETPTFGVFLCLLTGDREHLPPGVARAFRDSGAAHILAVSGLHLVLLVGALSALARRVVPLALRRRAGLGSMALLVVLYVAVCRFETPVVRSAVFVVVSACGHALRRRTSTLDHLALAAGIVVAWDPDQVTDVGFQLSFAAVAGIAIFSRRFRDALFPSLTILARFPEAMPRWRFRLRRAVAGAIAASLAAQVSTAPVVAATFGTAQPLGVLTNLVAVPIFGVVLPLALALASVGGAAPGITAAVADGAVWVFLGVVDAAASVPCGHAALGRPPPLLVALSVALLVAAAVSARRGVRGADPRTARDLGPAAGQGPSRWTRHELLLPAAAWSVVALGPALVPAPSRAEVVTLDVGHGLAVLVRTEEGTAMLYDAGGRAHAVGERTVVPALRALGVRRLAFLCLSHEDSDHCGAAEDVLREIDVDRVVVPAGFGASQLAASVLVACDAAGVPVVHALRGDEFAAAGMRADVLHPVLPAPRGAENVDSLVLRVVLAGADVPLTALLPGDLESGPLAALAEDPSLPAARVLVLPHHGRGDAAVQARLAARLGAHVLVASNSDADSVAVRDTTARAVWITGLCGAVRVRAGREPEAFPWPREP